MRTSITRLLKSSVLLLSIMALVCSCPGNGYAQKFNFHTTEASSILTGDDLHTHGFPDTLITWCNDWDNIMMMGMPGWRNAIVLKNNTSFVKFQVNKYDTITKYMAPVVYDYHLVFHILGFTNPADTTVFITNNDTLTINYNNSNDNTPFQDLNLKRYSNFYKLMVITDAILRDSSGILVPAIFADTTDRTFNIEASILTQHYDKAEYGAGSPAPIIAPTPNLNYLDLTWNFPGGPVSPVNYELEWTYVDDYSLSLATGSETALPPSMLSYNFVGNNTRVWLDTNYYRVPLVYPRGYIVYRVRAVRPDSILFKYPVYGDWSLPADQGNIAGISDKFNITIPYGGDQLNWQYTASFAEGGKYKNVVSFYDGLLKNRQSITRFNSNVSKLIATDNIYDYEGRLCIKTLPAPVDQPGFSYQYNVDLNAVTGLPYKAADFDTGSLRYHVISPLADNALANIYYSNRNHDTSLWYQKFIADAQGYPLVQTIFESGYNDRVSAQGGAGRALQIGDSNYVTNSYVGAPQTQINSLFGPNVGWSSFYTQTISRDPNRQYSMIVKDYHGKQIASALIGPGPSPATHAIFTAGLPNPKYMKQDLLAPDPSAQAVDTISGTRVADIDYFSEASLVDSFQYNYQLTPFAACPGQYISVQAHYKASVTDPYGNTLLSQDALLGTTGVSGSSAPFVYASTPASFPVEVGAYHVNKQLTFSPWEVDAALNSFFNVANCFLSEPSFIRSSVEAAKFPCPGDYSEDTDQCAHLRWQMIQQLFPNAVYGHYRNIDSLIIGTNNSIYTIFGCPIDTFVLSAHYHDSVYLYCYNSYATPGGDSSIITAIEPQWGNVNYRCFCTGLTIPAGCYTDTHYNTSVTITASDLYDTTRSIYVPFQPAAGGMTGSYQLSSNGNLGTLTGDIISSGSVVGHISHSGTITTITLPVSVSDNTYSSTLHGSIGSDTLFFTFTGSMSPTHIDSFHHFEHPYTYDSIVINYASPYCHYRYQDTCTIPSLSDTITVGGIFYSGLRTMRADSFTMVYNEAIIAGNYRIAEELLPLHPQYCELANCFTDTFKTNVMNIPDWNTALSMSLLYLDDLVSHDPLVSVLTAFGMVNATDSLTTYPGGSIRLDSTVFINAYCSCGDSTMFQECYSTMFNYEITHHLLTTNDAKNLYFDQITGIYFANRQRFVDSIFLSGGNTCAHCAHMRMHLAPGGHAFPPTVHIDSSSWFTSILTDSMSSVHDSVIATSHTLDSLLCAIAVDTIIARISNCIEGDTTLKSNLRNSLNMLHTSGRVSMGNYSYSQIYQVLCSYSIPITDLCNPYMFNFSGFGTSTPGSNCLPPAFYADLNAFLSQSGVRFTLELPGTSTTTYVLDSNINTAERDIGRALGNIDTVTITASYNAVAQLYTMHITPTGMGSGAVNIYLHSVDSANIFSNLASGGYSMSTACITSVASPAYGIGLVNEYSFALGVTPPGGPTAYNLTCWMDKVATMEPNNPNIGIAYCMPCTRMRALYAEFKDSLTAYGIAGPDHPYYRTMLANFMNNKVNEQYTSSDYETFIQSCALADSILMPLYTAYATFTFNAAPEVNMFIDSLDNIDTNYSFDDSYRETLSPSGSPIRVCVDLRKVPLGELWKYKKKLLAYAGPHIPFSSIVNQPLDTLQPPGQIGFLYAEDPTFSPADSNIIPLGGAVTFSSRYQKYVWIGGQFVKRYFFDVTQMGAAPYDISRAIYSITAYLYNHDIPGTVFTPEYKSTIDADYFKPEKQQYLHYTYGLRALPDYQVLDSVQSQHITVAIPSYSSSSYSGTYSKTTTPGLFANLYLWNIGMNGRCYDTLQRILDLASGGSGYVFYNSNSVSIPLTAPAELNAYRCGDNTYWFRYFTTGDTMFNVYVAFPPNIPVSMRPGYKLSSISPIVPMPGDSLNRYFLLNVGIPGAPGSSLQLRGMTNFVIGKSVELDNVLMRHTPLGDNGGADTFDNCERQTLFSAVNDGMVKYKNYIDSVKSSISGRFRQYAISNVQEKMMLGYYNAEQQYTLYSYDRAGNLAFTVPPAGVDQLSYSVSGNVDTCRSNNTPSLCPAPLYAKQNIYQYNTFNAVDTQKTINGGLTRFLYDAAGRLIFSQNAKQALTSTYTYNIYDDQNRITETGEEVLPCPVFASYTMTPVLPAPPFPACSYLSTAPSGAWMLTSYLEPDQIPYDKEVAFICAHKRHDVVMTIYDTAAMRLETIPGFDGQQNLRKKVSCIKYFLSLDSAATDFSHYEYATHYSYDVGGNVQTLTQDNPRLAPEHREFVRIDYDYDLISGKVNMLTYNRGASDQFYQRYSYDADNRITEVSTSTDGYIWDRDAAYTYYDHGPLARVELGDLRVQGMDYAYTIQGWLKALNSDTLNAGMDMGRDAGPNSITGLDAVAHTIDYFRDDYRSVTGWQVQHIAPLQLSLYNGNIARQTVAIDTFIKLSKQYVYDQLNRILSADYAVVNPATGALTGITDFHSRYSYDPDGNLQTLLRYGNNTGGGAQQMDSLRYIYGSVHNDILNDVLDSAADVYTNDLRQHTTAAVTGRYTYDAIGNITADFVSGQDTVEWNLYNKVTRTVNNADTSSLLFDYDGGGNRVGKHYVKTTPAGITSRDEYYVHDAQGNVLASYKGHSRQPATGGHYVDLALQDHSIYGSSRLGLRQSYGLEMGCMLDSISGTFDTARFYTRLPWYSLEYQDVIRTDSLAPYGCNLTDMYFAGHTTGQRQYELTDHLGDVLATVSDKHAGLTFTAVSGGLSPGATAIINSWKPIVVSSHDYYPFGEYMPGRYATDTASNCITTTLETLVPGYFDRYMSYADMAGLPYSQYGTITEFDTTAPLTVITGGGGVTLGGGGSSVITVGGSTPPAHAVFLGTSGIGSGVSIPIHAAAGADHITIDVYSLSMVSAYAGMLYEVTDGTSTMVGNIASPLAGPITIPLTTIPHSTDLQLSIFGEDPGDYVIITGIHIPHDTTTAYNIVATVCNNDFYRYGFNGQMKVNEIAGVGNHNTALFWEYDTRTGRRWNPDPVLHAWESPYAVMGGNPIWRSDVLGNEFTNGNTKKKDQAKTKLDAAQKDYDKHKDDKDISKRDLKKLQRAVDNAQSEYNTQVQYEKVANSVIDEFKNKNPEEFNKWNHFKDNGKEVDIPVTIQTEPIPMTDANGLPTGQTTTEGTTFIVFEVNNVRHVTAISSALVSPHFSTGQTAVISLTADMVHGLGHVQVYIKNGKTTENETENGANQYEQDVYNHGKGPKR